MTGPDVTTQTVIDDLDSFYCHNIVASLWADAVANRLEGMAIYLLSDELPEVAKHARAAARRLADRIGDLGGAITADHALTRARRGHHRVAGHQRAGQGLAKRRVLRQSQAS